MATPMLPSTAMPSAPPNSDEVSTTAAAAPARSGGTALTASGGDAAAPLERFELIMRQTLAAFGGPNAGLWKAQLELVPLAQYDEQLHAFLAGVQDFAASGLAELFLGISPDDDPAAARAPGAVLHSLFVGLLAKYFIDPPTAPTARELADGMRIVAERMMPAAAS